MTNINWRKSILISVAYIVTILIFSSVFYLSTEDFYFDDNIRFALLIIFTPMLFKYILQILVAPWYGFWQKKFSNKFIESYKPKVSLIVPAWNEEVGIADTMKSIVASSYPDMELIVVNDGSIDNTDKKVKGFIEKYNGHFEIRYIEKENGGKSSAINVGIKMAKGDIIITTDADSVLDQDAISNMVKYFQDSQIMAVAGNVKIGNGQKNITMIQQMEYLYGFYFKRADSMLNSLYIVGGAAAAYRRDIFDLLGHFDEKIITEDIEYSTRILNAGYKIRYAADAVFYTEGPSTFEGLAKQRLRWKYGRFLTFLKYRNLFLSLKREHSKFLTWISLPVALMSDIFLFFEVAFLSFFYGYAFVTHNFLNIVFAISLLTIVFFIQILSDVRFTKNKKMLILAPIAWMFFYFIDFVEYIALFRSIEKFIKKEDLVWQKWKREGVYG